MQHVHLTPAISDTNKDLSLSRAASTAQILYKLIFNLVHHYFLLRKVQILEKTEQLRDFVPELTWGFLHCFFFVFDLFVFYSLLLQLFALLFVLHVVIFLVCTLIHYLDWEYIFSWRLHLAIVRVLRLLHFLDNLLHSI